MDQSILQIILTAKDQASAKNKIIKTTNGYVVTLRPYITHQRFVEIQKAFMANMMIDPSKQTTEMQPFSAALTYETQEKLYVM